MDILIPMDLLKKHELNVNEYLVLYNLVNNYSIAYSLDYSAKELISLESKGYIKLFEGKIHLRSKVNKIFSLEEDYFKEWLEIYPVKVKRTKGPGSRALSPKNLDTVLARRLRSKWDLVFRKNIEKQKNAIEVLRKQLIEMEKSGDLEYMVEATRWLNEGYYEKYSYLLDEDHSENEYKNEDYL